MVETNHQDFPYKDQDMYAEKKREQTSIRIRCNLMSFMSDEMPAKREMLTSEGMVLVPNL